MAGFTIAHLIALMTAKPFRGKTGPEDKLAMEVANFLRAATLEGRMLGTWTHIPHEVGGGGKLAAIRMGLAKAMGLIAGSADYVFVWPDGGGWIELKTPTGSLNPAQQSFAGWCRMAGSRHAVCRSLAEVKDTLLQWGVLRNIN